MKSRLRKGFTLSLIILSLLIIFNYVVPEPDFPVAFAEKTRPSVNMVSLKKSKSLELAEKIAFEAATPSTVAPMVSESLSTNCQQKINLLISSRDFLDFYKASGNQPVGSWYYDKTENSVGAETTPQGKFLLALGRAGLLEGSEITEDKDQALQLLSEVHQSDPANSAPLLYAALIEYQRGNYPESEHWLEEAKMTQGFETYLTQISKAIFKHVRSSQDLVQAYEIWSSVPVPNYLSLKNFLKNRQMKFFALQLTKTGLDSEATLTDIEWNPLEYAVGKSLMDFIEPGNNLPTYQKILTIKNQNSPISADKIYSNLQATCDMSSLDPLVHFIQSRLAK